MANEIKAGLKKGAKGASASELQSYLRKYGYVATQAAAEAFGIRSFPGAAGLLPVEGDVKSGEFDDATETALRNFQRFNRLPETGELDQATANLMNKPRCGNPDVAAFVAV